MIAVVRYGLGDAAIPDLVKFYRAVLKNDVTSFRDVLVVGAVERLVDVTDELNDALQGSVRTGSNKVLSLRRCQSLEFRDYTVAQRAVALSVMNIGREAAADSTNLGSVPPKVQQSCSSGPTSRCHSELSSS